MAVSARFCAHPILETWPALAPGALQLGGFVSPIMRLGGRKICDSEKSLFSLQSAPSLRAVREILACEVCEWHRCVLSNQGAFIIVDSNVEVVDATAIRPRDLDGALIFVSMVSSQNVASDVGLRSWCSECRRIETRPRIGRIIDLVYIAK